VNGVSLLDSPREAAVLTLPGLAADNLLAFIALLGLLHALEKAQPNWRPRARWSGRPWRAKLLLEEEVTQDRVAEAADAGINEIAANYRFVLATSNQASARYLKVP
jgi:hypothetical protein